MRRDPVRKRGAANPAMGGPRVPPFFFTWHDMIRKRLAGERGQGIIECAVIFPIFVLLVFVVVDGGILMGRYGGVNHAADTGARLAATAPTIPRYPSCSARGPGGRGRGMRLVLLDDARGLCAMGGRSKR